MFDCAIIGGGIVGLATAMMLGRRQPGMKLAVLEKEPELALHQTGRNSGVIHSGIYYKPGSLKAKLAREGNRSLIGFCREHGIAHEICGKVIVATRRQELPALELLYQRAIDNGIAVSRLPQEALREAEPHVRCVAAIKVPSTGIVDYREVSLKYAQVICEQGGEVLTGTQVDGVRQRGGVHLLESSRGEIETRFLINCGGLHSDRVARLAGVAPQAKIIPFRGEYFELVPERRHLVNTLVYPVPNLAFPFLGVHFTRMIDGSVHAGPNAVLAFKREGYRKTDVSLADLSETLAFPGFWKMAGTNFWEGCKEMHRSLSKRAFVKSLQQLIPEIAARDLVAAEAGVRAQAVMPDGRLADDFIFADGLNAIHVCNAPSPAATASLEIGRVIAERVPALTSFPGRPSA